MASEAKDWVMDRDVSTAADVIVLESLSARRIIADLMKMTRAS